MCMMRRYPFVVTDGLVVKRDEETGEFWQLVSDPPAWKPIAWPETAEVVGEVRWMGREL